VLRYDVINLSEGDPRDKVQEWLKIPGLDAVIHRSSMGLRTALPLLGPRPENYRRWADPDFWLMLVDSLAFYRLVCEEIDYARQTRIVKIAMTSLMALVALIARGEDLAGHYILQGVMEVGSELLLKSDGTFEYGLTYGAADYWAKGNWRHENNCVVLNSVGRKEPPFRLLRSEAGKPGTTRVWVVGKNGEG
jgi:hypothetical protein